MKVVRVVAERVGEIAAVRQAIALGSVSPEALAKRLFKSTKEVKFTGWLGREIHITRAVLAHLSRELECPVEVLGWEEVVAAYPNTNPVEIGVFTVHPRDRRRLTPLEEFHRKLALERDEELLRLLGRMGAQSVEIEEEEGSQTSGAIQARVEVSTSIGAVGVQQGGGVRAERKSSREVVVQFEGNTVEVKPDLLDTSVWFKNDSQMCGLLECRLNKANPIRAYSITSQYGQSFGFDFGMAASVLGMKPGEVRMEFERLRSVRRSFRVEFGPVR